MSTHHNAGQTRGQTQAQTENLVQSAQNTANRACDQVSDNPQQAQQRKEDTSGFIQQTGEQVVHMAQGAIDGVKNTLGINEKK